MEQREFLDIIRSCRRRLNLSDFLKKLSFSLGVGAGAGIVFQVISFVRPLYYANVYTGIAVLTSVMTAITVSWFRQSTMAQAALVMDRFGFQERITTAYENMKEEGDIFALQRKDAMEQLKAHKGRIKIALWPDWRKIVLPAALLAVMLGLALTPSPMKDRAGELHRIRQEAREKEEEIEKVIEELEALKELEQETLTPEQLAALREMMESLQAASLEYQQASSAEALQAAGEKLSYKYENMSSQMSGMAQSLQSGATASPMSAESMQAMADKLQEMSGKPSQGGSTASNQGQNGQGEGGNQSGQGNSQESQGGQGNGQGSGQGNGQDGQGGGQTGQGSGQGNGQSGQGDGQTGQGSGQGNGQSGQSSGQGGEGSSDSGRGTGSVSASHDYVSIPNAIADSGNLTGNATNHDDSEYLRAQNGLSWEGTHMSHEAVIGSYEQNAYEGIAAGRYPTGMENVIKEYFASFN